MEKLKATIIKLINEKLHPNKPLLTPSQISAIEKKLHFVFPVFETPTHPTYSVMIESAIKALNKGEGLNEESISKYIKENYDGLPWAHDVYLNHHLTKLCENGEIVLNPTSKCYTTPTRAVRRVYSSVGKQPCIKLKWKTKGCMIDQKDGEGNSGEEKVVQGSENMNGVQGEDVRMLGNMKIKRRKRRLVFEDDDQVEGDETAGGVGDEDGNVIRRQEVVVPRNNEAMSLGNGDDSIEEWDCVGTVVEDDVSSVRVCHDKREGEGIAQGRVSDDTSAAKWMLVQMENVEKANDPELAVHESGLRESELMIVPYEGNTVISAGSSEGDDQTLEGRFPLIICGLAELPNQEQRMSKKLTKKKLKSCQVKKKVYSMSMPDFPVLAVDGENLLEHDQQQPGLLSLRQPETKVSGMDIEIVQPWLLPMLKGQYFIPCSAHVDVTRNECNMFCLDCMDNAFCHHCFLLHDKDHRVVQIRKASYRNSVRVHEIEKHIDISHIQTYVINSAKIVFLNERAELKPPKGYSNSCEICLQSLIDHSRFCSLNCKFFGTPQESSKLLELAADQSQQASSLEDGFSKQLERHKYLNPPRLSSLEEHMSMEEEENLPLHKVLKKCAKRKRHAVHNPSASTPLATAEALSISGTKSQLDLLNSENTLRLTPRIEPELTSAKKREKQQQQQKLSKIETNSIVEKGGSILGSIAEIRALELETDDEGMLYTDVGPPGFVPTEIIRSNDLQREGKRQNLAISRPFLSESSSLQNPEHQLKDQERQDCKIDARLVDLEAPRDTFMERNVLIGSQIYEEDLKRERGRSHTHWEASKEDLTPSNEEFLQLHEGLFKPASSQKLKQKNNILKIIGKRRPQKEIGAIKQVKRGARGRPRKHMEASEEDKVNLLNVRGQEQEGVFKPAIDHHSTKDGCKRLQKNPQDGSSELKISQNSVLKIDGRGKSSKKKVEGLKKKGRGRPRKLREPAKEDVASLSTLDPLQQMGSSSGQVTHTLSLVQDRKKKKDSQGQPLKQGFEKDATAPMTLKFWEQERQFEALNCEHSQQNDQTLEKDGWEMLQKQNEKNNDEDHAASIKQLSNDGQGRLRKQEVNKVNLAAPMDLLYELEDVVSDQINESKAYDCSGAKPEQSENEIQKQNLSSKRVNSDKGPSVEEKNNTWLDDPVDEPGKSRSEVCGVLETPPSGNDKQGNQLTQEQENPQIFHEPEINEGKLEGQVGSSLGKSTKVTSLHVPLSSKDQLRSRNKSPISG